MTFEPRLNSRYCVEQPAFWNFKSSLWSWRTTVAVWLRSRQHLLQTCLKEKLRLVQAIQTQSPTRSELKGFNTLAAFCWVDESLLKATIFSLAVTATALFSLSFLSFEDCFSSDFFA
jgi:hypothetical protein